MTDRLEDTLREWAADVRADTTPVAVPIARLRRRTVSPAVAALVSVVVALGVVAAVVVVRSRSGHSPAPIMPAGYTKDFDSLVVHDGDTVQVNGEVLAEPGVPVRACAPSMSFESTPFDRCPGAITVTGVDLDTLADRRTQDGAVSGSAVVTGVLRAGDPSTTGTIAVTDQQSPPDTGTGRLSQRPPCSAPAGGWPRGPRDENPGAGAIQRYRIQHDGIVDFAFAHPSSTQVVLVVVAASDLDAITAALRPAYGGRLCVWQATNTNAQVQSALDALGAGVPGVVEYGPIIGADWQLHAEISLARVTADEARLADAQPPGVVELRPWLVPVQ